MYLGKIIKCTRREIGITQADLANKSDITRTYLSQIENNQIRPSISILKNISIILNIPLPVLFFLSLKTSDIPFSKRKDFKSINKPLTSVILDILKKK
jgi:transcriptional regulator with XRE-family HTH domain